MFTAFFKKLLLPQFATLEIRLFSCQFVKKLWEEVEKNGHLCMNLGASKKRVHKLPYNAMPNTVLVGLKLFQDVIAGSISDKTTRVNFFLQTTEIRCQQYSYFINYLSTG